MTKRPGFRALIFAMQYGVAVAGMVDVVDAQDRSRPGDPGNGERIEMHGAGFDAAVLGALAGRFEAWKRMVLGGGRYYAPEDRDLRFKHAGLYAKLRMAAVEDRLGAIPFRRWVGRLLEIGEKARVLRGGAEQLSDDDRKAVTGWLRDFAEDAGAAAVQNLDRRVLMPKVNRMQVGLEEVLRFGMEDGLLSVDEQISLRLRFDGLEAKKAEARKDGGVSREERGNLWEAAVGNARDLAGLLRR